MSNKEKFLKMLYADADREKLVNFKLFPGSIRETMPEAVYGVMADSIAKERLGLLKKVDLDEEEKSLKEFTLDDIKRI